MSPRTASHTSPEALLDDTRWIAVQQRQTSDFVYAVRTTGIYCLPECPSRLPKREHVLFFDSPESAGQAGFRPCKRCQPEGPGLPALHAAAVARACRIIEDSEYPPKLADLARATGMSPYHLHRVFKRITGLTPKAFASAHRAEKLRQSLACSGSVADAVYEAGYQSSGRFYAQSGQLLGMLPKTFRKGGPGETIRFTTSPCSLGMVLVAASEKGVCAVFLGDNARELEEALRIRFPKARLAAQSSGFKKLVRAVIALIEWPSVAPELPLDLRGTAFQHQVWQALQRIPAGTTASYAEIARAIGKPAAVRAVAGACASNPLALLIPCHRVVHADGSLSGYRWGVDRKRTLLEREGNGG